MSGYGIPCAAVGRCGADWQSAAGWQPATTGAQLTKLSGKRSVGRRSRPAIVYYLNMYVRRSRTRAVIQEAEHLEMSERDSLRVLAVLKNPPKPNAKLLAAAKSLPKRK